MSEPRTYEVARASKLNAKLALTQVMVRELHGEAMVGLSESFELSFAHKVDSPIVHEQAAGILASFALDVVIQRIDGTERTALAVLRVGLIAGYRRTDAWQADDSQFLDDFIGIVGWVHVWPYLRAEIQMLSTKLGYPPLVLPLLMPGNTAGIPVQREAAAEAAPRKRRAKAPSESPHRGARAASVKKPANAPNKRRARA